MNQLPHAPQGEAAREYAAAERGSLLDLYIRKVAGGETAYETKLYSQLADCLLYIPVNESARRRVRPAGQGELAVVEHGGNTLVPVFTTRGALRRWTQAHGRGMDSCMLLGAEIALYLEAETWLWLNPGDQGSLILEPEIAARMAGRGSGRRRRKPTGTIPRIIDESEAAGGVRARDPSLTVPELVPLSRLRRPEHE